MGLYVPRCRLVGVDIGSKAIKVLHLTTSLTDFRITAFFVKKRSEGPLERLVDDIRFLKERGALEGDFLAVSFPSDRALFRTADLPFSQLSKIRATIRYEAEDTMISPLEEMVVDFSLLERRTDGSSVLITCVPRDDLDRYVGAIREGGALPDVVDVDALALASLMEELSGEGGVALIDVGGSKVSLLIFQDGRLHLIRSVPIGGSPAKGLEEMRPALDQIVYSLKAYGEAEGGSIDEIWLTGGWSRRAGLYKYLSEETGVRVSHPFLLEGFPSAITLPKEAHLFGAVAMGLALRGTKSEKGRVNLVKGIEPPSRVFPQWLKRRASELGVSLLILLALLGADFYLGVAKKEKQYLMLKEEIRRTFKATFPEVRRVVNELQQAKEMVRRMEERGIKIRSARESPLEVLREVALRLPQGTKVLDLDITDEAVTIRGMAPSFAVVDGIKKALSSSASFAAVKVGNIELVRRGGKGVVFKMILTRRGS